MAKIREVFVIQPDAKDDGKKYWRRCGVAFLNWDDSLNVKLDLFPNVQFQIRDKREAKAK
jgi:hypothetical protein